MTGYKVKVGGAFVAAGGDAAAFYPPDDPALHALHVTYGDELEAAPLGGSWTKRNIAQAESTVAGQTVKLPAGVEITLDAAGDGIFRAAPSGDFELVATLTGPTDVGGMIGPCILDAAGTGVNLSYYNNGNGLYLENVVTYAYSGIPASNTAVVPTVRPLYYLALKKVGTTYTGRVSVDGTAWTAISGSATGPASPTQIGILRPILATGTSLVTVRRFNVYPSPGYYA